MRTLLLALAALATPAVALAGPAPVGTAEADRMADNMVSVWTSMDPVRIKALYAPTVDGFDYAVPMLAGDRATWDKRQDAFAAAKMDGATQKERKVQILTPDVFVVSGTWSVTSSAMPQNNAEVRCTDVFQRSAAKWLIVNEHCSAAPKAG